MENTNPIKLKYTLTVQDYGNGRYTAVLNGYVYHDLDKQGLLTLIGIYFDAEFDARDDGEETEAEEPEKVCKNCKYYVNFYGHGQCYGQKDAPRVDDNETCKSWKKGGAE